MASVHVPVMVAEVLEGLHCRPGGIYVDATTGHGGHAQAILAASAPDGYLVGLDQDPEALAIARVALAGYPSRGQLFHRCYTTLPEVLKAMELTQVDGIVMDLGLSTGQLETSGRGFSFQRAEPLDMRMDPEADIPTAAELLNRWSERDLEQLFREYGEERFARRIARRVVEARQRQPWHSTGPLVDLIRRSIPGGKRPGRIHPATRVFQALRIAVNQELTKLAGFLPEAAACLAPEGRLVVISYHSLEDRIVKQTFLSLEKAGTLRRLTKKPLTPTPAEVDRNPRARSAKLRVAARVAP